MIDNTIQLFDIPTSSRGYWHEIADRVLAESMISPEEGLAILRSEDDQLLDLLSAAYRVRYKYHGNHVHLNFLINAKSGYCGEDCGYCSQSKISTADISRYNLVSAEKILDGARVAVQNQSKTYCIVISGRSPSKHELKVITTVVPQIKEKYDLSVCASVGLLSPEQAAILKSGRMDKVNNNLNTSRRFSPNISSTHTYQDRLDTLSAARQAGLELCSGGIIGMGEEDADVVDLALELGRLQVEALPINFLNPIDGTPLGGTW